MCLSVCLLNRKWVSSLSRMCHTDDEKVKCVFICLSFLFVCLYFFLFFISLFLCIFVCLLVCLFVHLSVCLLVLNHKWVSSLSRIFHTDDENFWEENKCALICLSISLFLCVFVCLRVCPFVHLSVCTQSQMSEFAFKDVSWDDGMRRLNVCLFVSLIYVCLSVCLFVCVFVCLSVCTKSLSGMSLSVRLSICTRSPLSLTI